MLTSPRDGIRVEVDHDVDVTSWDGDGIDHDGAGTAFVLVLAPSCLTVAHATYPLPAGSYAVVPERARIDGGCGLVITHRSHRGLLHVGGPVESRGRLRYIDGCSDTLLVAPIVRGDPCLNLLYVPAETAQTDHEHPSARIGLVVRGRGSCVLDDRRREGLGEGSVFVLPAHTMHRFETARDEALLVIAWHPDSETGPTDDDHPMLNRTLRPDTSARVR